MIVNSAKACLKKEMLSKQSLIQCRTLASKIKMPDCDFKPKKYNVY